MTVSIRDQKIAKAKAFTAAQRTPVLVQSLRTVQLQIAELRGVVNDQTNALRLTRSWIISELEERYPNAAAAVAKAFDDADAAMIAAPDGVDLDQFDVDYEAVLINAIPVIER